MIREEPADESKRPEVVRQADAAMKLAAMDVVARARCHNTPIVVWRDGKVVELDPFSPEFDDVVREEPPANEK